jgi:hypothetical protein
MVIPQEQNSSSNLIKMFAFQFPLFFKLLWLALFEAKDTDGRLTPRRMLVLLLFLIIYPLVELLNHLCFLLDNILYPDFKEIEPQNPVFLIGVPRSGTTFLHRLLAKDSEKFTSFRTWEIFLAPSILQKKFYGLLGAIDKYFGGRLHTFILAQEDKQLAEMRKFHETGLFETEEDELLLLHIFASPFLAVIFPFPEQIEFLSRFDENLTEADKKHIMGFYKSCVQKHLFVYGAHKQFLSKNPAFSGKVRSLAETFTNPLVIYCLRSPLETLPSFASWFAWQCDRFFDPLNAYPMVDTLTQVVGYWYRYPLQELESWPEEQKMVVRFREMVKNPQTTVQDIYEHFGLPLSEQYQNVLAESQQQNSSYKSKHKYSLPEIGLEPERVFKEYEDILLQHGFTSPTP